MNEQWKPVTIEELCRIADMFKAPMPAELRMNHAGYELLRDEIPLAVRGTLESNVWGLPIQVDNDIPPDRIVIVDQYGHLLNVNMLPGATA